MLVRNFLNQNNCGENTLHDIMIQYDQATEKVLKRPLLIGPPWINKFYILDLRPRNSFVKWAVSQGHTVFVISWVNPDEKLSEKGFDDYMKEGYLAAIPMKRLGTGADVANACIYLASDMGAYVSGQVLSVCGALNC